MMEHRYSRRYAIDQTVRVFIHGELFAVGHVANANRHGAFLELPTAAVERGHCLEAELKLPGVDRRPARRRGLVVHCTEQGVGVMFVD
jgi:hypothetical protein